MLAFSASCAVGTLAGDPYSWRYYRPSNTGIQGDYCEAILAADGGPYIGGYDPSFEEGGFSRFVETENRWINYSNVDYPVIGDPRDLGSARVSDIVADASGRLWLGTWRGALTFDPSVGGASIQSYGPRNSALPGERTTDLDIAPDGTVWFVSGGLVRFDPASQSWTYWQGGQWYIAAQPRSGGGYYVWSADRYFGYVFRFDDATGAWTWWLPSQRGQVAGLPGKDCVDDAGNFWALRLAAPGDWETLDYQRPDGSWVTPPPPYPGATFDIWAFKAYGDRRALLVDGGGTVWRFDGSSWQSLGTWRAGGFSDAIDVDARGNVWVCGIGGAARRDVTSGTWQRYRITNTSQFSFWPEDISVDPEHHLVYAGGNAGTGLGGLMRFDGQRWLGWNAATYGMGFDWPFPNDNCTALTYRPSSGRVAVSPLDWLYGIHEWTGSSFERLGTKTGAERMCEDSFGRLWAIGEYYDLDYFDGNVWRGVAIAGWGANVQRDPDRPGTVWACANFEAVRTDGAYRFARDVTSFTELDPTSDVLTTVAVAPGGVAWLGSTGGLFRLDAGTGLYEHFGPMSSEIPGSLVSPLAVSPDGRVWFTNFGSSDATQHGLCWFDGTTFGLFPAPEDGGPQWGGLPHAQITDIEVRVVPAGYELWMSCLSRGIAVLTVELPRGFGPRRMRSMSGT